MQTTTTNFFGTKRALLAILFGLILVLAIVLLPNHIDAQASRTLSFGTAEQSTSSPAYTIPVIFTNDKTPVNAERILISYDPDKLFVYGLSITKALCEERFVISNTIDHKNGIILIECGTITPLTGTTTVLATLYTLPLKSGTTTLSFDDTSGVYAHDGHGTQIIDARKNGVYEFEDS